MDSILVVNYSYSGVSRRAAQLLASHHGWPLGTIEDRQPRVGARGTWRCVLDSLLDRRPRIRYSGPVPEEFRTVVLVTPIWMYRLAGPMRSFLHEHRLRRVAVVVTMGSAGASNAFAEVRLLTGKNPIETLALTAREVETGSGTTRLIEFGDRLQPGHPGTRLKAAMV
jgi:hypothetical protein